MPAPANAPSSSSSSSSSSWSSFSSSEGTGLNSEPSSSSPGLFEWGLLLLLALAGFVFFFPIFLDCELCSACAEWDELASECVREWVATPAAAAETADVDLRWVGGAGLLLAELVGFPLPTPIAPVVPRRTFVGLEGEGAGDGEGVGSVSSSLNSSDIVS